MQIRRVRAADLVLSSDTATVLALFAGFVLFAVLLTLTLVFDPPFLGVGAWAILLAAVESRRSRPPRGPRRPPEHLPRGAA
jgi:hypothetical protein